MMEKCNETKLRESADLLAERLVHILEKRGLHVSSAESCTGGMIASFIVGVPGASNVFEEGYVTYSDRVKEKVLGVKKSTLQSFTAVSGETASEMALGLKKITESDLVLCTTGYAGPDDGDLNGLVYISAGFGEETSVSKFRFKGNRSEVRLMAVEKAFEIALTLLGEK